MAELVKQIKPELIENFCKIWNIREFSLFGSALRDDFTDTSDVDVMVSFQNDAGWSLLDHVTMRDELIAIFGRDVDLVTRKGVERSRNAIRRKAILETAQVFMQLRDLTSLQDIVTAVELITSFIQGIDHDAFDDSLLIQSAVVRQIEIVGEATKRLSSELRQQYTEIPWKQMAGMRDILIHAYDSIDPDEVWNVACNDLPRISRQIHVILESTINSN